MPYVRATEEGDTREIAKIQFWEQILRIKIHDQTQKQLQTIDW